MEYRYVHVKTDSAIGFFACLPEPAPDLETALALLESRRLDKFLYRFCLELIADLDARELRHYARIMQTSVSGQQLLAEAAEHLPDLRAYAMDKKRGGCGEGRGVSADAPADLMKIQRKQMYANIHQHSPIELAAVELEGCKKTAATLGSRSGSLAARYERSAAFLQPARKQDLKSLYEYANQTLSNLGLVFAPESRHEASLSPIGLLREWHLNCGVEGGPNSHTLKGTATAYGRGLSLAQARISCIMEIVERASAFVNVSASTLAANGWPLLKAGLRAVDEAGHAYILPRSWFNVSSDSPVYWRIGHDSLGRETYVPAQAVYLFLNLDEPQICDQVDSTGLGAGQNVAQAKLAALTEVLERYAHATTPFAPDRCFRPASRDPVLQGLLDDYRWRGIHVQFQDITTELGLPSYRCFVKGLDGTISQASGANLSGKNAALAAMTETPWPYSWETGRPSPSARAPVEMPTRFLEDLPDYNLGCDEADLELLEGALLDCGLNPVYVELTRPDIGLPVFRCMLPALETDSEFETNTGAEFQARLSI